MSFWRDLAERTFFTYVEVLIGLLIAARIGAPGVDTMSVVQTALVAAIPAALAVLKGGLASRVGDRDTAAMLRPSKPFTLDPGA